MVMKAKQEILDEARQHVAEFNKGFAARLPPVEDPLQRWKRDSEEREAQREAARRERRAEEARERRSWRERETIAELRAQIAELRGAIDRGDALVLSNVAESVLPIFDRIGDRLDEISNRVDQRLKEMEERIRSSLSEARATAKFFGDASTSPPAGCEIN